MVSHITKIILGSFFILLIGAYQGRAQSPDSLKSAFIKHQSDLTVSVNSGDQALMMQAREGFKQLTSEKQYEVLATYYLAYADYRLSSLFEDMPEDEKEHYLDSAISRLEKVTEMDPDFAEGWALLGNCYGMKATGMISGMRYGPKSDNAIKKALELAPKNPRAEMINGIGLMYKPALFGGSNEKAIAAFKDAGQFFKQWEPASELYPQWGYAENFAWLAQAYLQENQPQKARDAYQQALEIDPDYYWIKEILLPELNEEMN